MLYDPETSLNLSADTSAYGLGAVLLQKTDQSEIWRPVTFASRAMSEIEQRYSQIEKKALATVWTCEKLTYFVLGKKIHLETDDNALVFLFSTTPLDRIPPRILRFRLRLTNFNYTIQHVPGKSLFTADALSRAPKVSQPSGEEYFDTKFLIRAIVALLPINADRLGSYRMAQKDDNICCNCIEFCQKEWPTKHQGNGDLALYWRERGQLTVCDGLLLHDTRIVISEALRAETLQNIYCGQQEILKFRQWVMA